MSREDCLQDSWLLEENVQIFKILTWIRRLSRGLFCVVRYCFAIFLWRNYSTVRSFEPSVETETISGGLHLNNVPGLTRTDCCRTSGPGAGQELDDVDDCSDIILLRE